MTVYSTDLYTNILLSNRNNLIKMRIISGYASAKFLSKVLEDFKGIRIELYIGMTQQGLSVNNHKVFKKLVNANDKVSVFYQYKGKANHMKIIELSYESCETKVYLGSANFTENGYIMQNEIMAKVDLSIESLIDQQLMNSVSCLTAQIKEYITLYEDEEFSDSLGTNPSIITTVEEASRSSEYIKSKDKEIDYFKNKNYYINRSNYIDEELEIAVVLPESNNINWDIKGINSYLEGKKPTLDTNIKVKLEQFFPEEVFNVTLPNGKVVKAKLSGEFNRQIEFLDFNLYLYFSDLIGLSSQVPITFKMLEKKGISVAHFIKVNEKEYTMMLRGVLS